MVHMSIGKFRKNYLTACATDLQSKAFAQLSFSALKVFKRFLIRPFSLNLNAWRTP